MSKNQPISKTESDIYNGITIESDAHFAYIAGYTPGGASYGISREEMKEIEESQKKD